MSLRKVKSKEPRQAEPVQIVADAGIATGSLIHGKLTSLVIIDTSARPDIDELVRVHKYSPPGDVECSWGSVDFSDDHVALFLRFSQPVATYLTLNFRVPEQGILVEQILLAKALFIQPGRVGDRFTNTIDAPKILIEVPCTGFRQRWDKIYLRELRKKFRASGLSRVEAKKAAKEHRQLQQKFGAFRMR